MDDGLTDLFLQEEKQQRGSVLVTGSSHNSLRAIAGVGDSKALHAPHGSQPPNNNRRGGCLQNTHVRDHNKESSIIPEALLHK